MNIWDFMLSEKERCRPEKGFRVVGNDTFCAPGTDSLYPIQDFDNEEDANALVAKLTAEAEEEKNMQRYYVYTPDTY